MNDQNLLRTAKVSKVDYQNGMISVIYNDKGQSVSAKMPMMNFNDEYYMPSVGSQVQVMLLSNGSSRGVVLGNTWEKGNKPRSAGKGVYRKDYSKTAGACTAQYSDDSGEYSLTSGSILLYALQILKLAGATINIDASGKVILDTPLVKFDVPKVTLTGGEDAVLKITNQADITLASEEKVLEAIVKRIKTEIKEAHETKSKSLKTEVEESAELSAKSDRTDISEDYMLTAGQAITTEAGQAYTAKAGTTFTLEDNSFKTTLSEIMERLESLDGNSSARK